MAASVLAAARTVLLVDWPSRVVPEALARAGGCGAYVVRGRTRP